MVFNVIHVWINCALNPSQDLVKIDFSIYILKTKILVILFFEIRWI